MAQLLQTVRRYLAPAAVVLAAASAAHAAPTPVARTLDVEVIDAAKGATDVTKFSLVIDGTKPSKISLPIGDLSYFIDARSDPAAAGTAPINVRVNRVDHRPGSPMRIDVEAAVASSLGARTILANAVRPDGSRIEVAIRLH